MFGIQNLGKLSKETIKAIYDDPEMLTEIEFANRSKTAKQVWIEPTADELELDAETEYKIITHDKFFRIEFDADGDLTFYLQYAFGFKLYRRPTSGELKNPHKWELFLDTSDVN